MSFIPRTVFPQLESIPRSYYLGHHAAGLAKMKTLVNQVDLVIECRDYRVPLCSRNPMFEEHLGERPRLIVYTKKDLGCISHTREVKWREATITKWDNPNRVMFTSISDRTSVHRVLGFAKNYSAGLQSLTGTKMLVVGMPNVGKSTLLNTLRNYSLGKRKAARTGDQPGVTRKIGSSVKILAPDEERGRPAVYLLDTPGVFVPYVPDAESMLKLALCGSVKDTVVPTSIVADYLLYKLNLEFPAAYHEWSEPTNELDVWLTRYAMRQGLLMKGGEPNLESAALRLIQRWRRGAMGRFVLDDVNDEALGKRMNALEGMGGSLSQARKADKMAKKEILKPVETWG